MRILTDCHCPNQPKIKWQTLPYLISKFLLLPSITQSTSATAAVPIQQSEVIQYSLSTMQLYKGCFSLLFPGSSHWVTVDYTINLITNNSVLHTTVYSGAIHTSLFLHLPSSTLRLSILESKHCIFIAYRTVQNVMHGNRKD